MQPLGRTQSASTAAKDLLSSTNAVGEAPLDRPRMARQLFLAGVELFAAKGYHVTTTRDLASHVGLSPAAVYVHYRHKEQLLFEICRFGTERALQSMVASEEIKQLTPRLRALVHDYAVWLATNHTMARVILHEYRWLSPKHFREVNATRRKTVATLRAIIELGIRNRFFVASDTTAVVTAIISFCADIPNWFPARQLSDPEQVGSAYAELAVRMVEGREHKR
jgi:AcrR family transcriptional regulator